MHKSILTLPDSLAIGKEKAWKQKSIIQAIPLSQYVLNGMTAKNKRQENVYTFCSVVVSIFNIKDCSSKPGDY
jgi:hypothetical protein